MKKVFIWLMLSILCINGVFPQSDLKILYGEYELNKDTILEIPREEILLIDSLQTNNSQYPIKYFQIEYYLGALGNNDVSNGNKFPQDFYKRVKYGVQGYFIIRDIKIGNNPAIWITVIIDDSYIYFFDTTTGRQIKGKNNTISKQAFLSNNKLAFTIQTGAIKLGDSISGLTTGKYQQIQSRAGKPSNFFTNNSSIVSYRVKITSVVETKEFDVVGDSIPNELKKYICQTKEDMIVEIKDVIIQNKKGEIKKIAGLIVQLK
ncbi:MAG: hypothetical protein LBR81_07520 [Prevotellaceae bacterium]|jgi:hypothetical protein|nr:hypothetical protein [Prevotellaceae bacterium]